MKHLGMRALCACVGVAALGLSSAMAASLTKLYDPITIDSDNASIFDPEFGTDAGGVSYTCWQAAGFVFARLTSAGSVDTGTTGQINKVDPTAYPPAAMADSYNGPEPLLRGDGSVACVGSLSTRGVVLFSGLSQDTLEVPGSDGLWRPLPPPEVCPTDRFYAVDANNATFLFEYVKGAWKQTKQIKVPGWPNRWLSCDELMYWSVFGGYWIHNINDNNAKKDVRVTSINYSPIHSYALTANGAQWAVFSKDTDADIYRNTGSGWALACSLKSPDSALPNYFKTQVFVWPGTNGLGDVWMTARIVESSAYSKAHVVLVDVTNILDNGLCQHQNQIPWTIIGTGDTYYYDTENLVRSDGSVALYLFDGALSPKTTVFAIEP
jgi:hypothetical protein